MSHTPIVFVVDDDASVRKSLGLLIDSAGWQAQTFASAHEFMAYRAMPAPSCLILDVALPDLNGLELQQRIADRTDLPIIFITGHCDVPMSVRAMKAGALEFLTKPFDDAVLLGAVRQAIAHSDFLHERNVEMHRLRDCYASLSSREREVLALVASGLLNKQIAGQLGISEITVKAHRGNVMRKMQAPSFADLVRMAEKLVLTRTMVGRPTERLASSQTRADASHRCRDLIAVMERV